MNLLNKMVTTFNVYYTKIQNLLLEEWVAYRQVFQTPIESWTHDYLKTLSDNPKPLYRLLSSSPGLAIPLFLKTAAISMAISGDHWHKWLDLLKINSSFLLLWILWSVGTIRSVLDVDWSLSLVFSAFVLLGFEWKLNSRDRYSIPIALRWKWDPINAISLPLYE